ncbi:hemagglutinin repeat-containing protein [Pseudomonas sp. 3A(2025)]
MVRGGFTYVSGGKRTDTTAPGSDYATLVPLDRQLAPDLAQQALNPTTLPGFSLPTGQNGLFRLSDASTSGAALLSAANSSQPHRYLIETNPALTDLRQFLSSSYLLDGLGLDADTAWKRLGDGYYEQRLIQQAVVARTGQRFINGLTSDEAMFKYLMDNAIASQSALNLSVGVGLSGEQVAALTHDIVWMEDQVVRGEHVLVPVLYLAQANNRLAANGALIQGNELSLIAGNNLTNVGVLKATSTLQAGAGNSLINEGLIQTNERLNLQATNDVLNRAGGVISGRDVSLVSANGDVSNERTVTSHQSAAGASVWREDFASSAARIEAAGDLTARAGRDVNNSGVMQAAGNATLVAGRDVNVVAAQTQEGRVDGPNHTRSSVTQLGAELSAGQNVGVQAGRDINVTASQVASQGNQTLLAGENIRVESAANQSEYVSRSKRVTEEIRTVNQQASQLQAGGNLVLDAGTNLDVVASQLNAQGNVALDAGQDINLTSALNEDARFYAKKSKGSFGRSSSEQRESYDSTNVATEVNAGQDLTVNARQAADGSIGINGARDVTVIGSQLKAGNDLVIGASNDVAVLSGVEEHGAYSQKSKSGFLGLSKSGKSELQTSATQVASGLDAKGNVIVASGKDIRLRASDINAGNDVDLRAGLVDSNGDINLIAANDEAYSRSEEYRKKTGLSVSGGFLSISSAKQAGREAQSSTSVGSQVTAERDAALQAERDINVVGSRIQAGGQVNLNAGRDVNVLAAQNSRSDQDWEKKRQSGIGISGDDNGVTLFAGIERTAERNRLEQQTAAASQINAGQDLGIRAGQDINQIGSDLQAGNDINLAAQRNILIDAASERQVIEQQREQQRNGLSGTINHNFGSTKDAVSGAGKGDDNVSKASSTLKAVDSVSQFLAGPTSDGKFGTSKQSTTEQVTEQSSRASTLEAGNDVNLSANNDVRVRGSQMQAGRDINVMGRDVTLEAAKNSFSQENRERQSWGGIHGGTSGGFKIGVGGSNGQISGDSSQGSSTVSSLTAGQDINLKATNDLTLVGTQANAERNIDLQAGNNLNIRAAQNDADSQNNRKSGGGEVGLSVGSEGVGIYASVNLGKGNLERESQQQQQAYLYAGNRLAFSSGQDTTISGATLRGNEVVGRVGRDLMVSSAVDTGQVEGKEYDLSATVTVGPGAGVSGSVGYGTTNGSTYWVDQQARITGKNSVDIRTQNHTQLDGALIAADSGKLKLDTGTLGFSDIAGKDKEHGYYLNVGGSYGKGTQDPSVEGKGGKDENGWSLEGWNYEKDRQQIVRATLGSGDIVVRNDALTGADSTNGLNRDVDKAYEITRDDEQRTNLYASSRSIEAVSNPVTTAQVWTRQLLDYNETAKKNFEQAALDASLVINRIERGLGRQLDSGATKMVGNDFAEATMESLIRGGLSRSQALETMADPDFQEKVLAELDYLSSINLEPVKAASEELNTSLAGLISSTTVVLDETLIHASEEKKRTAAQDVLSAMGKVNDYIQEHETEREAVTVVVALAGGPKALVQLAIVNAAAKTDIGQQLNETMAQYSDVLGTKLAIEIEGTELSKEDVEQRSLIGGGVLMVAVLTGVIASRKSGAESRTVSMDRSKNANSSSAVTDAEAGVSKLPRTWDVPSTTISKFPESWAVSPNKKGTGFRWQDPKNKGNGVRIDKGEAHISQPTQQVDHVIVRSNGKVIGRDGKPVVGSIKDHAEEVHIPLSEYRKWEKWNSPN